MFSINNLELALCIGAFAFPEGEIETVGLQKVAKFGEVAAVIPHSKRVDIE